MNLRGLFETMLIWINDSSRFISGSMNSQTMDPKTYCEVHKYPWKRISIVPLKANSIISNSKHNGKLCLVSCLQLILCYLFSLPNQMTKFFLQSTALRRMRSNWSLQFVTRHIPSFYSYAFLRCRCFKGGSDCFPLHFNWLRWSYAKVLAGFSSLQIFKPTCQKKK